MLLFILIAVLNGMVNVINKIVNLQATKALGTVNGTLINYMEGTVISLAIVLFIGKSRLEDLSYWERFRRFISWAACSALLPWC